MSAQETQQEAQKAKWKQPDGVCVCMKWLEEQKLIRWGETADMVMLAPVIDPFRNRRNAPFAFIKYCPNCGEANFDVTEPVPAPMTVEEILQREG